MAFMECHFHSTVLGMACVMNVILPQPPEDDQAPLREAPSFSGVLDLVAEAEQDNRYPNDMRLVFGSREAVRGTPNDLCHLLEKHAAAGARLPWLYQWCGTEDFLYPGNRRFAALARRLDVDLAYAEGPGGHAWNCWDVQVARFLELLRQRKLLVPACACAEQERRA